MSKTPLGPQVKVEITEEIILHAIARDSQHCMIADAVKASFPQASMVSVDLATIRFTDPRRKLRYTYLTPRLAQLELVKFDQGIKTEPFSFTLRGAHVTRSGARTSKRVISDEGRKAMQKAGAQLALLKKTKLKKGSARTGQNLPLRVGGQTPPIQKSKEGVPFSRRRAFGLRGLEL